MEQTTSVTAEKTDRLYLEKRSKGRLFEKEFTLSDLRSLCLMRQSHQTAARLENCKLEKNANRPICGPKAAREHVSVK